MANLVVKENDNADGVAEDPYQGVLFRVFGSILKVCMRFRWLTVFAMILMLVSSVIGFGMVKQSFFPPQNTPMFYIDMWMPEGTDIRTTIKETRAIEKYIGENDKVEFVSSSVGRGMLRFMLTYQPEKSYEAYSQLQVRAIDRESMFALLREFNESLPKRYHEPTFKFKLLQVGPSPASKIETRISGPDPDVLRNLAQQVEDIFNADPGARNVRHDWRERVKEFVPRFNETQGRRLGITKQDLSETLQTAFGGRPIGLLREGASSLPIVARLPDEERASIDSLQNLKIWSPVMQAYIPVEQIVDSVELQWADPIIQRYDRKRTLTVLADHDFLGEETAANLFQRLKPKVDEIALPIGYEISWGGEYESSTKAQQAVFSALPVGYLIMFIITIFLFNSIKKPLVIWFTVPLAIIGVFIGLFTSNIPFSFTALLGLLSLSGMILKNGIVLLDQINTDLALGKEPYHAIYDSAISRVRPVSMAALTTILGMIPLLFDAFFNSMAITIMAGLGFATILTLIVVPVTFALFHRIRYQA